MQSPTSVMPDKGQCLDDVEITLRNISIVEHVTAVDTHASYIHMASMRQILHENSAIVRQFCRCSCHDEEVSVFSSGIGCFAADGAG